MSFCSSQSPRHKGATVTSPTTLSLCLYSSGQLGQSLGYVRYFLRMRAEVEFDIAGVQQLSLMIQCCAEEKLYQI